MDFKTVMVYNSYEEARVLSDELTKGGVEVRLLDNSDKIESDVNITDQLVVELQLDENQLDLANTILEQYLRGTRSNQQNLTFARKLSKPILSLALIVIGCSILYFSYYYIIPLILYCW